MADSFIYDVFLSHNQTDKPQVRRLAERLRSAGVRVWLDEWVVKPGDIIALKADEGLEQSRVLVLCISPTALASGWVALERSTVVHRDPSNAKRRFIPILLAECELPDTLAKYKYLDFRDESEVSFTELLAFCGPETDSLHPFSPYEGQKSSMQKFSKQRTANKHKPANSLEESDPLALLERKLKGHTRRVNSLAVSPYGSWVVSGSDDHTVKIWDLESGECRATLKGYSGMVFSVAITPDGKRILSGSNDYSIRVWDVGTGRELAKLDGDTNIVRSVLALQDNVRALSGGFDNTLRLWDLSSNSCIKIIKYDEANDDDDFFGIAVNRVGTHILSGHRNGLVRLWNVETGECLMTMKGHLGKVNSLAITPDGCFAVSGSDDKTIKIWHLESGTCVGTMEGHQAQEILVAISPDGTLIASTGYSDTTVRLWDLKSGLCLQVIKKGDKWTPISVAFTTDGSRLLVGSCDGDIHVYRLTGVSTKSSVEVTHRCYVNAKVLLLGEGTVGKTSLAHRLIEDKYVVKDRTHGMNVWRLELPLPPDTTLDREALLWDLAGQEDYRLIHQLFLEQTALALLLINPQKEDPFIEAGEWLKALKSAAGVTSSAKEALRLLVFSQVDVGEPKLGNAKIDRFCEQYGFAGWLLTSAKNGRNCSDKKNKGKPSKLKQLIAENIPWEKLEWTSTPHLLAELKSAVMAMRDKSDIRLLRFTELAQRLEQILPEEKFVESDLRTAVTLLANHGLVRLLNFGDLVLLRPDLINGYAGAVIRAARSHTDEIGCVPEADINNEEFDFTGVERLKHRPDEELLLRALVQTFLDHSLCIAEETPNGRHLVFPSQYRREKDLPHEPDIFVSYTFSGEWQTVWTTLVVRLWYSQEFGHKELWHNAAEFESSRKQTLGLKVTKEGDGIATISLYFDLKVPDELKVIFIEYVHRHLAKYACDVTRDRRYVCCGCGRPFKDLELIRELLNDGEKTIVCQKCRTEVELIDFIEQRLKSDPVAQKILAMEQTATRQLDTQALEQILIGHIMAIAGEANQIFRLVTMFDYGIDGEVEFKDNDGKASGKKIYVQLKSGNSYLRTRKGDGREVFDVTNDRHLDYWVSQPVDVYLVIRQKDETIRWMNVTSYLKNRKETRSRQIIFEGKKLDATAMWKVRDQFF
ncbi:MAG: TIR domain-containing protein [Geobacteraceae bacterium]|nr:TIR domain-containing protein [Geobacteraceae bacterium]